LFSEKQKIKENYCFEMEGVITKPTWLHLYSRISTKQYV